MRINANPDPKHYGKLFNKTGEIQFLLQKVRNNLDGIYVRATVTPPPPFCLFSTMYKF